MARPSQVTEKRRELLPVLARAFAELGYRRTTTAELARRCGVRENILYRLWPDKKAMFIAAIGHVYDLSLATWRRLLEEGGGAGGSAAHGLLAYEAKHHGEYGYYRIVFAGLSETDDPEIRTALAEMYERYQRFIRQQITAHRGKAKGGAIRSARGGSDGDSAEAEAVDPALAAWAVIGLGTVASITRELGLVNDRKRQRLFQAVGRTLLGEPRNRRRSEPRSHEAAEARR